MAKASLLLVLLLCCTVYTCAARDTAAQPPPHRALPPTTSTCLHDRHARPLHTLPQVQLTATTAHMQVNSNTTTMTTRTIATMSTTMSDGNNNRDTTTRPLRIRLVEAFSQACTKAGDVVPTYTDGATATHTCTDEDVLTSAKRRAIAVVLREAVARLSRAYRTLPTPPFTVQAGGCYGVPSEELRSGGESDLVVFVTAAPVQQFDATIAWARACVVMPDSRVCGADQPSLQRPVVGHINFVPGQLDRDVGARDVRVAMHELTHVLGFTQLSSQLRRYVREDGTCSSEPGVKVVWRPSLSKNVVLVTTPRVLRVARRHLACDTLDGVEIEDAGGDGTMSSHWKKRVWYDEALVGTVSSARLFYSSLTMAAMEDMGMLFANYAVAEDGSQWGRARGCAFATESCKTLVQQQQQQAQQQQDTGATSGGNSGSEFCLRVDKGDAQHCTFDRSGIGFCNTRQYNFALPRPYQYFDNDPTRGGAYDTMDYCPAVDAYNNVNCVDVVSGDNAVNAQGSELGPHSRCFESNLVTNALPAVGSGVRCYPAACTPAGQLLLRIQGQTVACPADGRAGQADTSVLRTLSGTVSCPRAQDICAGQDSSGLSTLPAGSTPPFAHSPVTIFATDTLAMSTS